MVDCPDIADLIEEEIDRVLTQYRESPNLLSIIRTHLREAAEAYQSICAIPNYFDIDDAEGDQLTLIGKRLGFQRCHCVCVPPPVFGFGCGGAYTGPYTIVGFCDEGTWRSCQETGVTEICITDDDVYRGMLKARRYQARGMYDLQSLQRAAKDVWGETASVESNGGGKVTVSPGRSLSTFEALVRPIAFRALPISPGIKAMTSNSSGRVFGFGEGWGGFCGDTADPPAEWLCPVDPYTYSCP